MGGRLELLDAQVRDVAREASRDDALHLDDLADQRELSLLVVPRRDHDDLDGRSRLPAHPPHELLERRPSRRVPGHGQDAIARLDPRAVGGRALDRRDDDDPIVPLLDLEPDPAESPFRVRAEDGVVLRRHVRRVRVELGDHALDGTVEQLRPFDGVDVAVLDHHQHAGQLGEGGVRALFGRAGPGELRGHRAAEESGKSEGDRAEVTLHERKPTTCVLVRSGEAAYRVR
jgi:hypothetical protein